MPRDPKSDAKPEITQEMIRLYDDYTHLSLDRRGFMANLSRLAGGTAAAAAALPLIAANAAHATIIAEDDPAITAETVTWPGEGGEMQGYLVRPTAATGALPAVIIIHENRGLNEHTRDVARRAALEGFVALAPDFLSPAGGTPTDEDQARELISGLDREQLIGNLVATSAYLRQREDVTGPVGVMGFCWGGGAALNLAVADPDLGAAVAYYGSQPAAENVPAIKARLMMHYAGLDERINAGIPAFREALDASGTDYQMFTYDGVNHAFNNDTSDARYDQQAADLAWGRTFEFFTESLGEN